METRKGLSPAYPQLEAHYGREGTINYTSKGGMSIRLKIASDAMCAILTGYFANSYPAGLKDEDGQPFTDEKIVKRARRITDELLKQEEENL